MSRGHCCLRNGWLGIAIITLGVLLPTKRRLVDAWWLSRVFKRKLPLPFTSSNNNDNNNNNNNSRVQKAKILLQHLKQQGQSSFRMDQDVSVVSVGQNECGIQLLLQQQETADTHKQPNKHKEIIYVDRDQFLTPTLGQNTHVGRAMERYLQQQQQQQNNKERDDNGAMDQIRDDLPSIYLAVYLCICRLLLLGQEPHHDKKMTSSSSLSYLDTLPTPQELQHLPIFWSQDMLSELQGSALRQGIQVRRQEWEKEYQFIKRACKEFGSNSCECFASNDDDNHSSTKSLLDLDTWFWARSIISSRAFTATTTNRGEELCLVPYVDMMNHISEDDLLEQQHKQQQQVKCTWEIDSEGYHLNLPNEFSGMECPTTTSKMLGISYGSHSNANFLMNYGFSILKDDQHHQFDNHERAMLSITLPQRTQSESTSAATVAMEAMWEADGLGDCHQVSRNITVGIGQIGPMESALSMCRVASAQGAELSIMKDHFAKRGETTRETADGLVPQMGATLCRSPYSIRNEVRALRMFQQTTVTNLRRYATTLTQDNAMLSSSEGGQLRLSNEHRNALILRREEKQVLLHFNILASMALSFLETGGDFDTYNGILLASLGNAEPLW